MTRSTRPDGALPSALAHAWRVKDGAPRRGPKASLSVDMIVDAAMQLISDVGVARCSLSRVAERLGVTTNALYRYIESRAELDVLLGERALGPPPDLREMAWQDGVRQWVLALRQRHREYPWLVDVQTYVPLLPRVLGWLDELLAVLSRSGMSLEEALSRASVIDGYVRSAALRERERATAPSDVERALWFSAEVVTAVTELARQRGLQQVATVLEDGLFMTSALVDEAELDYALELLIEGLEREVGGTASA